MHRRGEYGRRRVVVTGVGLVSPVGIGTEVTWRELLHGTSGIAPITLFDASRHACTFAGEVKGFAPEDYLDRKDIKKSGRFIQFAMAAAQFAMTSAGLSSFPENSERLGVYVGSGIGGFEVIEREHLKLLNGGPDRVSPFFVTATVSNIASGQISVRYGAQGPNLTCATACTTGARAVGEAWHVIRRGDADAMICGGSEAAITPLSVAGFASMRALSTRNSSPATASRPWDTERDGFVLGEGAGILVLEELGRASHRGVRILAEVVGYAANSDAYHLNTPPEDGRGVRRVMELALESAALEPDQVNYLNAHATSTPLGDLAEAKAIHDVFGAHTKSLLVSSTKSMTGHLLGGAGSLEAGITVLALRDQIAPPTTNLVHLDPEVGLNLVRDNGVACTMEYAMSNSFGFGGTNASLIFRRWHPENA